MISTADKIFIGVAGLGFAFALASVITSVLNRSRFKEICVLYKEKFGNLPDMVVLFDDVNTLYVSFAYSVKMQFIFKPLLWNKSSHFTRNDDKNFIRGLPKKLIGPFYLEIFFAIIGLAFLIGAFIIMKVLD